MFHFRIKKKDQMTIKKNNGDPLFFKLKMKWCTCQNLFKNDMNP